MLVICTSCLLKLNTDVFVIHFLSNKSTLCMTLCIKHYVDTQELSTPDQNLKIWNLIFLLAIILDLIYFPHISLKYLRLMRIPTSIGRKNNVIDTTTLKIYPYIIL